MKKSNMNLTTLKNKRVIIGIIIYRKIFCKSKGP
jgi:hypothetical protein